MTIQYQDGKAVQGLVLYESENLMRMALEGSGDTTEFRKLNGRWMSEACKPVMMWLGTADVRPRPTYSEEDFICPKELAARVIDYLFTGNSVAAPDANSQMPESAVALAFRA